ncbi:MAG: hypothetical protein QGG31_07170, partial [Anaerolineales bacterium]|nr:hypothetical protein [Anaerolineales bacterium]
MELATRVADERFHNEGREQNACFSVCLSVCLSVFLSVWSVFEPLLIITFRFQRVFKPLLIMTFRTICFLIVFIIIEQKQRFEIYERFVISSGFKSAIWNLCAYNCSPRTRPRLAQGACEAHARLAQGSRKASAHGSPKARLGCRASQAPR